MHAEVLVVGAGVVGLAVARALARAGREVVVVEAADAIGTGVSARNSEVVHGGMYYPPGSLKAATCVAGRRALYAFCDAYRVPHRRLGKLIVADQTEPLAALLARGRSNGVEGLRLLDRHEVRAMEPAVAANAALWSPETGIVDTHAFMLALWRDARDHGATLALKTPVRRLVPGGILTDEAVRADWVINAAGLGAPRLAATLYDAPRGVLAKGSYFALRGRAPFTHLVYPLPEPGGLGIHLTLNLAGRARFGPDVEWVDTPDYTVDPARTPAFEQSIRTWWPDLPVDALQPDMAAIRPKLEGTTDFRVDTPEDHGVDGLICLLGIESPGLTAALALADRVASRVEQGREVVR